METLDQGISKTSSLAEPISYKSEKPLAINYAIRVIRNTNPDESRKEGAIESCTTLDTMGHHILMQNVLAWSAIRPAFEKILLALQDSSANLRFLFSLQDLDELSSLSSEFAIRKSQIVAEYKSRIFELQAFYQADRLDDSFTEQMEKDGFNSFMAQLQYNSLIRGIQHPNTIRIFRKFIIS